MVVVIVESALLNYDVILILYLPNSVYVPTNNVVFFLNYIQCVVVSQ